MVESSALFARIEALFDVMALRDKRVLIAGCGSGGSQVAMQLAMAGVHRFTLVDNDVLSEENLIRHACGRRHLGQRKVQALTEALLDRNPAIEATQHDVDLMKWGGLEAAVAASAVVVVGTDNESSRYKLNEHCVAQRVPMTVGRVFTRGIGGEAFSFRPRAGACLACLESLLQRTEYRDRVREVDLVSEDERNKMYGMEVAEIKDSPGLNVDISFITCFHTRFTLDALMAPIVPRPTAFVPIAENYVVWGNRPVHPFKRHFQLQRMSVTQQEACRVCREP